MLITRHSMQRTYGVEFGPRGMIETDGILCFHCGAEESGKDGFPYCTCCDKFICRKCVGKGCWPLEARLDEWERREGRRYLRRERLVGWSR